MLRSPQICNHGFLCGWQQQQANVVVVQCRNERTPISQEARIRDEVISPFRKLRLVAYPAAMAAGGIAALTALPRLVAALAGNATNSSQTLSEIVQGLGIDVGAVVISGLLYRAESRNRELQLSRLNREESLAALRVELGNGRLARLEELRGTARLVIIAGSKSHIDQALQMSQPFEKDLKERGITLIPFVTDADEQQQQQIVASSSWIARPAYTAEWSRWMNEQKGLANVPDDKPVYLSLRMDGRVRGSGVGFPPWSAFVAQLPPVEGVWGGPLDGMDGRV